MNTCPHCKAKVTPHRLLLAWRRYRCARCGEFAQLSQNQALFLGLFNAALGVFFIFAVGRSWHLWQRVGLYLVVTILTQKLITWFFMRFVPVKSEASA